MDDTKTQKVGYANPPTSGRFRKGQSGNPKGRPKRIEDPYTTLEKVLKRRVSIAGEDRKIPIREALMRRLRDRVVTGDTRALALQQKILKLAADASPHSHQVADVIGAKRRLAEMLGISLDAIYGADPGEAR